jgi:hypothetical protein
MPLSSLEAAPGAAVCRALPCNIESSSATVDASYFQPVQIDDASASPPPSEKTYAAAQFRGRGLLAAESKERLTGRVWKVTNGGKQLQVISEFQRLVEWQHEHRLEKLEKGCQSRVKTAQEWMQVASALHAPLPLDEKEEDSASEAVAVTPDEEEEKGN